MGRTSESPTPPLRLPRSRFAVVVAVLALALAALAVLSGFGARWGWWHFRVGFGMLRSAAYGGLVVAALSLLALYSTRSGAARRRLPLALSALVIALLTFLVPWQLQRMAQRLPPIHDITTDPEDPPQFVAIAPLRADAPNPIEYGGPEIAAQQRKAYPDIRTLTVDLAPERAFEHALNAARAMGWEIVASDSAAGRIEATDQTIWYGFKDDVVIRLTPADGRTVLDVRSVSRVGRGDLGVNARRVRDYLEKVRKEL
jgi:uncharacterized protein (DUF1499 family)